ncbi:hypothetical protein [Paenibacillus sp. Lou8.1]|nr:hypothetical protein [Paenibacillus sp. Lou8.1]
MAQKTACNVLISAFRPGSVKECPSAACHGQRMLNRWGAIDA